MQDTFLFKSLFLASALVLSTVGFLIWQKKKSYIRVAKISKLFFYPVKSLKGIEVSEGKCTKRGFEVAGLLDRSFMLVNEDGILVSQRDCPSLVHLIPHVEDKNITILAPFGENLTLPIKQSISETDKIITCNIFGDLIDGVDCGDEVAAWFQAYLGKSNVRLVQQFPSLPDRKYVKSMAFYKKIKKDHPVGFQDLSALHILSQSSVDYLNTKLEKGQKVSVKNFRPNILLDDCEAFAEDTWKYVLFDSGANLTHIQMTTRCLLTTNNPETGELTQKEPLVTLRKFRIACDPEIKAVTGSVPCFGTACGVLQPGEVKLGDNVYAICSKRPGMLEK